MNQRECAELRTLSGRMDRLDDELVAAERAGNASERIALLRERARAWRAYSTLLGQAGRDSVGATLAAMRDETTALQLEGMK
jgi:hypothetical protein